MRMRPRPAGLATLFTLMLAAIAAGSEQPPSSLLPPAEAATVWLSLEQQVVRECQSSSAGKQLSCSAREEVVSGQASITFRPVREASLKGRHSARVPVTWSVDSGNASSSEARPLPPGIWRLEWPGYAKQPTFRVEAGGKLRIMLKSKRGRCGLAGRECKLVSSATQREVEFQAL